MASRLRRIAFISEGNYGHVRRLARGIGQYAVPKNGLICKEFDFRRAPSDAVSGQRLAAWSPDAILFSGHGDDFSEHFKPYLERALPLVALQRLKHAGTSVVIGDAYENFKLIYEHFGARVAGISFFVAGPSHITRQTRETYEKFAAERGLAPSIYEHDEIGDLDEIRNLTRIEPRFQKWLLAQPKPLGLFSFTTHMSLFLSRACRLAGLRVPEDVMLIGADDLDVAAEADPPVTCLRLAVEAMGERAVRVACEELQGAPVAPDIIRVAGATIIGRRSTRAEPKDEWNLDAALAFIDTHACEGINVEALRLQTQRLSREAFQRKFRAAVGVTPREWIERRRMSEARRLLLETEMTPGWIAGLCGYPDYMHFYTVFRKVNGVAPTEFRDNAK